MTDPTAIPVNLYENERELMVVAPMPGVSAEDISVEVTDDGRLTLRAAMHGEGQERIDYLLREWSYGPFERTVELPRAVDASRANLSFGNGVLTIALPKSHRTASAMLAVAPAGHARGMTAGHSGGRGGARAD
ncbi:MAG TPA: Hsp20/alpha crystallin family protein [Candidatus Limnocylindria bacterium]|nr:Hsp20/alpha crystallin family protein [Candidatus Limnocylindria bacterium]